MARVIPGKEEFHGLVDWFAAEISATGVELRLGTEATPGRLAEFDEVIVATGVLPRDPAIPGQDGPNVVSYVDVLRGGAEVGPRVAIVGAGGIGFDVAEFLVHQGDSPTSRPSSGARNGAWRTPRRIGAASIRKARGPRRPRGRSRSSSARPRNRGAGSARRRAGFTGRAFR
jgi:2,4-dienoyl-CoA reductase (NADPH2)